LFVIPGDEHGSSMVFARRQAASLRALGVAVEAFFLRSRTSPLALLREWRRFRREAAAFRPEVVHGHFGTMTGLFTVLAAGATPSVITYRGSDLNPVPAARGLRAALGRLLSQLAALRARRIVCVSAALRRRLWWRQSVARVLPSGVDLESFRPLDRNEARRRLGWPAQGRVVLFNAGHDVRNKRLDLAEAAVACLRNHLNEVRMEVLRGDCQPERMPLVMNAADCLLVASDAEGSPSVIQEALASNLPIVSVPVGDVSERLAGVCGTRIARRAAASLAKALLDLLAEPRRSTGRKKAEECSAGRIARQLLAVYREAAGTGN
jgi:glycosyltransferase involved in cell wall biosynthesis